MKYIFTTSPFKLFLVLNRLQMEDNQLLTAIVTEDETERTMEGMTAERTPRSHMDSNIIF